MNLPPQHQIIRAFGATLDKGSSESFWFVPGTKEAVLCGVLFSPYVELSLSVENATEIILSKTEGFRFPGYAPNKQWIPFQRPLKIQCLKGVVTAGVPLGLLVVKANVYFLIERI